eukprot:c14217_g1_i1.p1 GENE.c14217_g1_i1~~c14217_g1_i1.p1  ORF type:complete len:551 (+),score=154.60 c14217_g1_i1:37-1689(+)
MSNVIVLNQNTKRESGRKAQKGNIQAGGLVADIIRTTLGPRSMLKMLLDPMGGIALTSDGHAILREIDVTHPAAKMMIDLARTQDEEVGDGTTSVIILAGEVLQVADPLFDRKLHPTVIVRGYSEALDFCLKNIGRFSIPIDIENREELSKVIQSCLGTKFTRRWSDLMTKLALDAVLTVKREHNGSTEIDIKRYARIEKIPGGDIEDSKVLKGIMINKDVVDSSMKRRIVNPRIVLLDCSLEYKKGESQTSVEITKEEDFQRLLELEEEYIKRCCLDIIAVKPTLVCVEKGVSDLAAHYLSKAGITVLRRLKKLDNNRLARASGATIQNRTDNLKESDVGTECGLFEVKKIADEYFSYFVDCANPKACTVVLRGATKDVLNEIERNLHDAMSIVRNVVSDPRLCPGGGAVEMALAHAVQQHSPSIQGTHQYAFNAIGVALEIIPRTLAQNSGSHTVRAITELRAKHAAGDFTFGVDGETGKIVDMKTLGVWEPIVVKTQELKTAIESASMLLRIDEILSGMSKKAKGGPAPAAQQAQPTPGGDDDEGGE